MCLHGVCECVRYTVGQTVHLLRERATPLKDTRLDAESVLFFLGGYDGKWSVKWRVRDVGTFLPQGTSTADWCRQDGSGWSKTNPFELLDLNAPLWVRHDVSATLPSHVIQYLTELQLMETSQQLKTVGEIVGKLSNLTRVLASITSSEHLYHCKALL